MKIEEFYLKDHGFQIYVNKGCQTYGRTPEEMFQNKTVQEVFKEMQKGGCNTPPKTDRSDKWTT